MAELDPTTRQVLEQELAEAEHKRAELDAGIKFLRARLGLPERDGTSPSAPAPGNAPGTPRKVGRVVADTINEEQFYGLSANKAAAEVLRMVGRERPLRTREIFDAVSKGGARVKDTEVMGKMMKKSPLFHALRPGLWGLAEWYPASVRTRAGADGDLQDDADENEGEVEVNGDSG